MLNNVKQSDGKDDHHQKVPMYMLVDTLNPPFGHELVDSLDLPLPSPWTLSMATDAPNVGGLEFWVYHISPIWVVSPIYHHIIGFNNV